VRTNTNKKFLGFHFTIILMYNTFLAFEQIRLQSYEKSISIPNYPSCVVA